MRMTFRTTACVVLLTVSGGATANEPGKSEAEPYPKTLRPPSASRKDVEDVERFIEEHPDAPLEMSHLKTLDPVLAGALCCEDNELRSVVRKHVVGYQVAVTTTVDGEQSETLERREAVIEQTVPVKGRVLYLNGLQSISPETALALAGHTGELHLNGLKSLPPEVAAEFARGRGGSDSLLSLDGLESLDDESAELLGETFWAISLRGLKRLSQEAYDKLVQRARFGDEADDEAAEEAACKMSPAVWFSPDLVIEWRIGHGAIVSVSDLPAKDTFSRYAAHLSRCSGTCERPPQPALTTLIASRVDMFQPVFKEATHGSTGRSAEGRGMAATTAAIHGIRHDRVEVLRSGGRIGRRLPLLAAEARARAA